MASEQEFREKVLDSLARLETKMNALVGVDGNNGRMGSIEDRVEALEEANSRQRGFIAAAGIAGSIVWGAVELFMHRGH